MSILIQDLRYGLRLLTRSPGFSATAVLTLSVGIGANAAMFSVVNAVLLRPLSYPAPEELVAVWGRFLPSSGYDFPFFALSGPEVLDYQNETRALSGVAPYRWASANLTGEGGEPTRVTLAAVASNLFSVLSVPATLGRTFLEEEDRPGASCVVVLGHGLFLERFGGEASSVGRPLFLDGERCEIVGVMPEGFRFPDPRVQIYRPLALDPANPGHRDSHALSAVGRLAPGVSLAKARAEMETLMAAWAREHPESYAKGHFLILDPLHDDLVGSVRPALLVLMGAVGCVILIVCANVANLLLARAESRRKEMAVRATLGAGRGRLVRQLLTESLLLAALGGGLGVLAAGWALDALLALYPGRLPLVERVGIDGTVLVFALALSAAAAFCFGLVPAFQVASLRLQETLKTETRTTTGGPRGMTFRRLLVVSEVALSLTLVVGAGLLAKSFTQLRRVDPGFDSEHVLTASLNAPAGSYPELAAVRELYHDLLERIGALPGVESVGMISSLPLLSGAPPDDFRIENRPAPAPGEPSFNADFIMVSPGLFESLRMPLRRGRLFNAGDTFGAPYAAIVNEATARKFWPNQDPVGQRIQYYDEGAPFLTIVGVVGDVRSRDLEADPRPAIYAPHGQSPRAAFYAGRVMSVVVRSKGRAEDLAPLLRSRVRERDPNLPVAGVLTMDEVLRRSVAQPRFTMLLMGSFAGTALLLALVGIYGVLAYAVAERTHEIGIRMALGAGAGDVLRMVVTEGLGLTAVGIVVGLGMALLLSRSLSSLLFGVSPTDPATFAALPAAMGLVSFLASYLPSRRATRVDPMIALRYE